MKTDCPKKSGANVGNGSRSVLFIVLEARSYPVRGSTSYWTQRPVIDSGASDHMVNTKLHFPSVETLKQSTWRIPRGHDNRFHQRND